MDLLFICELFEKISKTPKSLDKTLLIGNFIYKNKDNPELKYILNFFLGRIFPLWDKKEIGVDSKLILKALSKITSKTQNNLEHEWAKIGDLGELVQSNLKNIKQKTLFSRRLSVNDLIKTMETISNLQGNQSTNIKISKIIDLFTNSKPLEAKYITRILLQDLRIGTAEGILRDAIIYALFPKIQGIHKQCKNKHFVFESSNKCIFCGYDFKDNKKSNKLNDNHKGQNIYDVKTIKEHLTKEEFKQRLNLKELNTFDLVSVENPRELYNEIIEKTNKALFILNDFYEVFLSIKKDYFRFLNNIKIKLFRPYRVMLAQKVKTIKEAFNYVNKPAAIEYKYDGFRVQIHKSKNKIKLFTRNLEDITEQFPEIIEYIKNIKHDLIIEGEAVGFDPKTEKYLPFQKVSQRIKRIYDIDLIAKKFPVELHVFDIVYFDKDIKEKSFKERREILNNVIIDDPYKIVKAKQIITSSEEEANLFYQESLNKGFEGVMFKNLNEEYKFGLRVGSMIKLKPVMDPFDLVITKAEWGTGKRSNWLTSFTLSCIDENNNLLEIGKLGSGFKEKDYGFNFNEITKLLKPLIISENGKTVEIKPKIVVEVGFEEIQKSTKYSSGYALRFPRLIRIRYDKPLNEITTIDIVKKTYLEQRNRNN